MYKEKDIKKLTKIIDDNYGENPTAVLRSRLPMEYRIICNEEVAKAIIEAGYGDTKQAVREFVKDLRKRIDKIRHPNECVTANVLEEEYEETIDELLAEVTGE